MYHKICKNEKSQKDPSNAGEARKFWKTLSDQSADYNTEVKWPKEVEEDIVGIDIEQNIAALKVEVLNQLHKIPNWKSRGLDGVHRFWLKRFPSLPQEIAVVLNRSVQKANIKSKLY